VSLILGHRKLNKKEWNLRWFCCYQ